MVSVHAKQGISIPTVMFAASVVFSVLHAQFLWSRLFWSLTVLFFRMWLFHCVPAVIVREWCCWDCAPANWATSNTFLQGLTVSRCYRYGDLSVCCEFTTIRYYNSCYLLFSLNVSVFYSTALFLLLTTDLHDFRNKKAATMEQPSERPSNLNNTKHSH